MPNLSFSTFTIGARQFVVHDALEIILSVSLLREPSLTPSTIVLSKSFPGALTITLFAPALICFSEPSLSRNTPVDSMTISTLSVPHGRFSGFLSEYVGISIPSILIAVSPTASTSTLQGPYIESFLSKYANSLFGEVSFIATISTKSAIRFARKNARPIRPNPLIATRGFIECIG